MNKQNLDLDIKHIKGYINNYVRNHAIDEIINVMVEEFKAKALPEVRAVVEQLTISEIKAMYNHHNMSDSVEVTFK